MKFTRSLWVFLALAVLSALSVVTFYTRGLSSDGANPVHIMKLFPKRAQAPHPPIDMDPEFSPDVANVAVRSAAGSVAAPFGVKVYIYPMPGEFTSSLLNASRYTNPSRICVCCKVFYGSEIFFHNNLLQSPFVTQNPEEADFFFVPAYVSCLIKNGARIEGVNMPDLRATSAFMERALDHIRTHYPYWDRRGGEDHIWAFTQGYGAHLFGDVAKIRRSIFLVTNGQYSEHVFQPWKDIVIPGIFKLTPVYTDAKGPAFSERRALVFWGGTLLNDTQYSGGIRQYVYKHFRNEPDFRFQVSQGKWGDVFTPMRDAVFCLCLEGWWAWTPRPYEAILSGCIPVLVSDDLEYPFERFVDWRSLSVKISPQRISELPAILRGISKESIASMQAALVRHWRAFHFTPQYEEGHATDLIVRELAAKKTAMAPSGAVGRGRRRGYQEEWGFARAGEPSALPRDYDSGAYRRTAISTQLMPKSQCAATDPRRVKVSKPTAARTHCHGAARLPGERGCTRHNDFGVGLAPGDSLLFAHPFDRGFELRVGSILSTEGRALRQGRADVKKERYVTVATQATVDRVLARLPTLVRIWKGPVSVAVLVDNVENDERAVAEFVAGDALMRQWVDIHFVRRRGHSSRDPTAFYPINMLRNFAFQQAQTEWVMVLDVDVLPSACMEAFVAGVSAAERQYAADDDGECPGLFAYIPPSIEFVSTEEFYEETMGRVRASECAFLSKANATSALRTGTLRPMHMYFPPAYMPTNHLKWMESKKAFEVSYSVRFEPYYVVRRDAPLFNDSFVDRGGNFAQQVFHMFAAGYRFVVLPDVFTIDIPHDVAHRASVFHSSLTLWDDFVAYVSGMYGVPRERGLAAGAGYNLLKEGLFKIAAKFPNTAYEKKVSKYHLATTASGLKEEDANKPKYVLLVMTHGATDNLKALLEIYCDLPSLWGVVVVWNNVGVSVPPDSFSDDCRVRVHYKPQATNQLSNRYSPDNLPADAPDGVFMLDDDILLSKEAIEFAFKAWLLQQEQIVGFIPRVAVQLSKTEWKLGGPQDIDARGEFNFVLLAAAFVHKKHFDAYWRAPKDVLSFVASEMACDDIALNLAVALQTRLPTVWVEAKYGHRKDGGTMADAPVEVDPKGVYAKCLSAFMRAYRNDPLVLSTSVVRPIGRSFAEVVDDGHSHSHSH